MFSFEIDEGFLHRSTYLHHLQSHTGIEPEKKYKCPVCERAFTKNTDMRKHQETHNEERKFQCGYCKKMFRTRKVLSVHKSLHTSTFLNEKY